MEIWEPFNPIVYFLHTIIGSLGIISAVVALSVVKGSNTHILAGRTFTFAAIVAAVTAIAFSFVEFSGAALASSLMTFSLLGSALLALKPQKQSVKMGEVTTTIVMTLALLWLLFGAIMSIEGGGWLPPFLYSLFPLGLVINDIRFLRLDEHKRKQKRITRHLSRMAFAFAIAVHAPIVSFSDELGIHPALAFFGPFIIWPVIILSFKKRYSATD